MTIKKNSSQRAQLRCSYCGKNIKDIRVLTEVTLEVYSWYVNNPKKKLENLNGLWKKNAEYFCEECFAKYVKTIQDFYQKAPN